MHDTTQIVVTSGGGLVALGAAADRARDYVEHAKARNTLRAYRADWRDFEGWCSDHGVPSLPAEPETVALYLSDLAGRTKTATLRQRLSAISCQ